MQDVYCVTTLFSLTLVRPLRFIMDHILRGRRPSIIHIRTSNEDEKEFGESGSVRDDKGTGYIFPGREMKKGNKICLQIF